MKKRARVPERVNVVTMHRAPRGVEFRGGLRSTATLRREVLNAADTQGTNRTGGYASPPPPQGSPRVGELRRATAHRRHEPHRPHVHVPHAVVGHGGLRVSDIGYPLTFTIKREEPISAVFGSRSRRALSGTGYEKTTGGSRCSLFPTRVEEIQALPAGNLVVPIRVGSQRAPLLPAPSVTLGQEPIGYCRPEAHRNALPRNRVVRASGPAIAGLRAEMPLEAESLEI